MRISLEWLKEYIDIEKDVGKTAELLTMAGLEVEGIDYRGLSFERVVTARVEERENHPHVEGLSVLTVSAGTENYRVVCGDRNVLTGDVVPLVLPGAKLPGGREIEKSMVKGVESEGMLCSEKELGITEDTTGVMILPDDTPPGKPLARVLAEASPQIEVDAAGAAKKGKGAGGYSDSIFEVGLTPNRPDCLSIYGFARELSALTGKAASLPDVTVDERGGRIEDEISVEIREPNLCHRYMARVIRGVKVEKSPLWLRRRLEATGVRAINNVVDVTNYVMLELGQPLHAFDLGKIKGNRIIVRKAGKGECLTTLDGEERAFDGGELLICDEDKPLALAGVMGGEESAVSDNTADILLESAYFEPVAVRKTARKLGLHTESSHRFERGVDKEGVKRALDRMAMLILEIAGGEASSGSLDNYPVPYKEREIGFRPDRCRRLLGIEVADDEILGYLKSLNMEVSPSEGRYRVVPPSYRVDIEREIDLVEEVARLAGYSSIPPENISGSIPESRIEKERFDLISLKRALAHSGFDEAVNYSFHSPDELDRLMIPPDSPLRKTVRILNPISEDMSIMRSSLIPGIMDAASLNINRQSRNLRLFEVGKVFMDNGGEYREALRLCALMTGEKVPLLWEGRSDINDLKGTLENLLDLMDVRNYTFKNCSDISYLHPGRGARVHVDEREVAILGELHPSVLENYDLTRKVYIFEVDLDTVRDLKKERKVFSDIPVYPFVERDVALLLDKGVTFSDIVESFESVKNSLVEGMDIFDQFEGEGIGEGKKSLAIRIRYRSAERTLTDHEVNELHKSIVSGITKDVGATVR